SVPSTLHSSLRQYLARTLPGYMMPTNFITLEQMPLTPNGKIDKKALPEPGTQAGAEYTAPRNRQEREMVKIWAGVLAIKEPRIGIEDNFFQLGGHSLKAAILMTRIHKKLQVKITLKEIFKNVTVKQQARLVKKKKKEEYKAIEPAEQKEYYNLSSAQKRIYILQQMEPNSTHYNMSVQLALEGELDGAKLQETFKRLIERHESLRTAFKMIAGTPVQEIRPKDQIRFEIEKHEGGNNAATARDFIRPFDLSEAPLLRVRQIKTGETRLTHGDAAGTSVKAKPIRPAKYVMMIDMHHIISDGESGGIIVKEIMALYNGEALPPLIMQYKDFSEWQNGKREEKNIKRQEAYWLKRLAGEIPRLRIPLDNPRPAVRSTEGSNLEFEIGREKTAALNRRARAAKITMYIEMQAQFNIFLSKLSGMEDIVVGTPTAGRSHADMQQIIGMFVNTLVMRNNPAGEKKIASYREEVKTNTLEAFENQEYQFEDLVENIENQKDKTRNPVFDVMFIYQNMEKNEIVIPGLKLTPMAIEATTAKFELTLIVNEDREKLRFNFQYSTALFKRETVERFKDYFINTVTGSLEKEVTRIADIEIITEKEKKQVLYEFNETETPYPKDKTIHRLFEEQVQKKPDGIAIVGSRRSAVGKKEIKENEEIKDKEEIKEQKMAVDVGGIHESLLQQTVQITYRELNGRAGRLANKLQSKGVVPGTIVASKVERSPGMIIAILGILKAGGAYLPIDPQYPAERIDYMLKDSNATILLKEKEEGKELKEKGAGNEEIEIQTLKQHKTVAETQPAAPGINPPTHTANRHLAYIIYTSGTTGRPKG
ncbi:MAG: AMP-binding protein, partial [bacterium]|nr:AMP-binding protein [bacterium]